MAVGNGNIPSYIKAKSPKGLRRLMLENNIKHRQTIEYFNIQYAQGYWFAWFHIELEAVLDELA